MLKRCWRNTYFEVVGVDAMQCCGELCWDDFRGVVDDDCFETCMNQSNPCTELPPYAEPND
jgi:hypothetical protein